MAESTVHSRVERCDCRWVGSIFIRILIELNCEMERTLPTNVKRVIVDAWVIDERIIFVPIHFFFYKIFSSINFQKRRKAGIQLGIFIL